MTPVAFAWRSLTREPLRAALGIAGVAAVGALLFNMLLLSRGLLVSFDELLESTGFDVRVTATAALPTLGPAIARAGAAVRAIRALPEVEKVVPIRFGRAEVLGDGGAEREVTLVASEPGGGRAWTMIRGEDLTEAEPDPGETAPTATREPPLPRSSPSRDATPPVVVNRELARELHLTPGSRIRLRAGGGGSALPLSEFHVSGIAEFPFEAAGEATILTTLSAYAAARGAEAEEDGADLLLVRSRPRAGPDGAVASIRRALPQLNAFSNAQVLERFGRTDFSYFRQISFVLSAITLFFAFLLIATLLTVSVNQRLGEVAALRALGFSRRRVGLDLLAESALLVGSGGALAFPLGVALARILDAILRSLPGLPERLHFFVFEPRAVALHCVLLAAAGLGAAVWPIALATRLPIAATLRKEVVS